MQKKEENDKKKCHLAIYTTQDWIDYVQSVADKFNVSRSKAGEEIIKEWSKIKQGGEDD